MEKIKKALEQAKKEREHATSAQEAVSPPVTATGSDIEYTRTKSLDGSIQSMSENRLISSMGQCEYGDALKILSTQVLQRMEEHQWSSIAVTSARGGEGKTTIAVNLGLSIAREFEYTVLLVDANLRNPSLHRMFGLHVDQGLSDYLLGDMDLSDVLINPRGINHFVMLPGGRPVSNSAELIGSPRMSALVGELTTKYPKRIIIFDMPAVLDTADTLSFIPDVDCALLVVEDDETKEKDVQATVSVLASTNVMGTVLNKSVYY